MTEQIIPNTDNLEIAKLAIAVHYANAFAEKHRIEHKTTGAEAWEETFKKGTEIVKASLEVPF